MSPEFSLVEALATLAKLHEELAAARAERDEYQRLWHRDANLLRVALDGLDRIASADFRGNRSPEQNIAFDVLHDIRKERAA